MLGPTDLFHPSPATHFKISLLKKKQTGIVYINVTLWLLHVAMFAVEKQWFLHILRMIFSLRYPEHKAHASFYIYICRQVTGMLNQGIV